MRFSFLTVMVALAASGMSVSASKTRTCLSEGEICDLPTDRRDQTSDCVLGSDCYDSIKRAGRFARRDTLTGLYKRSVGEELSQSSNSPGVGHKRSIGEELAQRSNSPGVGNKRSVGDGLSQSSNSPGVGHKRSVGEELSQSSNSPGVGH
ncbi:hypothetical protein DEU56DRAFT_908354 [Suillus clintonianus]|uniref:uncharacterized protein n=1 Tax=Suillus clintonianus TaxID=1904413 RepID=UPI001B8823AC|nr:uncharacterized protein DEU56DRAFT_908354 [Suillus clintonianus]KAG2151512.1 hypothetical protein DEU56DRAFT_908354 [Suillus clintonianus]